MTDSSTEAGATAADNDEEVCFTGFVMDSYCIDRGTLLDNSLVETLEEPSRHSFHCLVDVDRCVASGFQLLMEEEAATPVGRHCRVFALDDAGNDLLLQLARQVGRGGSDCKTCTGVSGPRSGFRATVYGVVDDPTVNPPLQLRVTRVANARQESCPSELLFVPTVDQMNCDSGDYLPFIAAHGSLMLVSWGFLLPLGVLIAKFKVGSQSRRDLWFQIHRILQPVGLLVAVVGWIVALAGPFDVLGSGVYDASFAHGMLGTLVILLGISQPVNAYLRPHKPEPNQEVSRRRKTWETAHRSIGWMAAVLGIVNCFVGMILSGKYADQFFLAVILAVVLLVVFLVAGCLVQRRRSGQTEEVEVDNAAEEEEEALAKKPDED